jgi:hypothetical protein
MCVDVSGNKYRIRQTLVCKKMNIKKNSEEKITDALIMKKKEIYKTWKMKSTTVSKTSFFFNFLKDLFIIL